MKRGRALLAALSTAAFVCAAGPAWSEDQSPPRKQDARGEEPDKLTAEEKEMIEHMEMLKHMRFFQENGDMEMLMTLDVLTANE